MHLAPRPYGLRFADAPRALAVSSASDPLEREADHAADAAVRGKPALPVGAAARGIPQRVEERSATSGGSGASLSRMIPSGSGAALSPPTRNYFESRFNADFGGVRVHTDGSANARAAGLGAHAYTVGSDIVFGAGEFRPETQEGRHLLAHELAHTVQQARGAAPTLQPKLRVLPWVDLGFTNPATVRQGNEYSTPTAVRNGTLGAEILSSLLASPRVFDILGWTSAQAIHNLEAHIAARIGIVNFAARKQFRFGAGAAFRMNPQFWEIGPNGHQVRSDVDRRAAVQDINNPANVGNPFREYVIACLAATQLTMEGGSGTTRTVEHQSADHTDWVPGDWGYIENTRFPAFGGIVGLEGENIIYTGGYRFWGHFNPGLEYKTLPEWIDQVNRFTPPAQALLLTQRTSTQVGLL